MVRVPVRVPGWHSRASVNGMVADCAVDALHRQLRGCRISSRFPHGLLHRRSQLRAFLCCSTRWGSSCVGTSCWLYGKFYNIAQAEFLARVLTARSGRVDQCVWYLEGIVTDCFLTTFFCWGAMKAARPVLLERCGVDVGNYEGEQQGLVPTAVGNDAAGSKDGLIESKYVHAPILNVDTLSAWLLQVGIWIGIITAVRLVVTTYMFLTQDMMYIFFAGVFTVLHLHSELQKMIFAVLIFPAFGDTFQIVVQDFFLKKPRSSRPACQPYSTSDIE
ncbi:unnamed protein product [Prorocentrum cordatum]|uniref:Uncharacterized protein n=1 Tax=Prorocentrum cordatum TaxID=2364126 RepID=A0ABN9T0B4_9DINO|nr:unnamed protein product [Polarella glacialis]